MKTFSLILASLLSLQVFSQDTLFTTDGKVIPAKVMEIGSDQVKYKKPSNPDGPMYVMSKSEIVFIEYKNGSKDIFASQPSSSPNYNDQANNNNNNNNNSNNNQQSANSGLGVNVMLGGGFWPFYRPWGWGWGGWGGGLGWGGWGGWYNRPYRSYGYYNGYHGGGYHGGGGHYGGPRGGGGGGHHR